MYLINKSTSLRLLPIWDCGTMVLCLSQRGEYSSPSSASRSPWLKNSSMHLEVHWWWNSHLLAGWDTSQEWSSRHRTLVLSKLKRREKKRKNNKCLQFYFISIFFNVLFFQGKHDENNLEGKMLRDPGTTEWKKECRNIIHFPPPPMMHLPIQGSLGKREGKKERDILETNVEHSESSIPTSGAKLTTDFFSGCLLHAIIKSDSFKPTKESYLKPGTNWYNHGSTIKDALLLKKGKNNL